MLSERWISAHVPWDRIPLSGGTHRLRFPRGIVARSLLFPTVSGRQLGLQLLEQEIARWSLPPKMHLSPSLPASDA